MTLDTRNWKLETGKSLSISSLQPPASSPKGFTLIEALVAVTIITLSIVGPITAANTAIVAARLSRDKLTASYLAQEGVEYVRAVRDDAYLADPASAWTNFLSLPLPPVAQCRGAGICTLSAGASPTLSPCSGSCSATFSLMTGGTQFMRTVKLNDVTGTDEQVISEVSWTARGTTYKVTIYDHLTPWQ